MKIIILLLFVFLVPGLYFTLTAVLKIPSRRASRVISSYGSESKGISAGIDERLAGLSVKLAKFIRINEYKRIRLENTLKAAEYGATPEEYMAKVLLKSGLFLLPVIPMFYIFPILNIAFILMAVFTYFKEMGRPDEILREKREKIEEELSRFVSTVAQEVKYNRDVLVILERYKKNAGPVFKKELELLCADMRSSNYEKALTRFEARFNSPQLSEVVRGLQVVLRGDDGVSHFKMLAIDFKQLELQRLKAKAAKIPGKVRRFSFVMLSCYVGTFFVIIIYEIMNSLGTMF